MTYKYFYRSIIIRLIIIIGLAAFGSWLVFEKHAWVLGSITALILLLAAISLVRYFNNINRWMAYFLLGIENEDSSLKVPSDGQNKAINEVYKGMQRLNDLFRQAKIDISSQEHYFRSVINQSATGLFSVNEKGRVVNINPAAVKLTQLHEYHHINALKNIDDALTLFIMNPPKDENRQSAIFENKFGQKLLFKLSEISLKNETYKLVAVSDITKELDSREVDAWIKLARTLSHEIMNNITPITTLSQVISGYFTKNKRRINVEDIRQETIDNTIKGLTVIEERSVGLLNFVENYRKFTKLPEPDISEVNLSALLENNLMAATAFEGFDTINLKKTFSKNLTVFTDEKLLSQVITNLLKNSVEALVSDSVEKPVLWLNTIEQGERVKIEIKNNGPAIPHELREQIFVPFFTTKANGSGIGLSLSKQIMLSMGGDIVLTPDTHFTVFTVTLG